VHGRSPHTKSAAHFTRRELARLLRRSPVQADFLLAGVDTEQEIAAVDHASVGDRLEGGVSELYGHSSATSGSSGGEASPERRERSTSHLAASGQLKVIPRLYWLDRAGGCAELPYASHGPASPMIDAAMVREITIIEVDGVDIFILVSIISTMLC